MPTFHAFAVNYEEHVDAGNNIWCLRCILKKNHVYKITQL